MTTDATSSLPSELIRCPDPCAQVISEHVIAKILSSGKHAKCAKCGFIWSAHAVATVCKAFQLSVDGTRQVIAASLDQGVRCPTCDQYAKRYRRKLNSGIARWLIALDRITRDDRDAWVHVNEIARALVGGTKATPMGSADFAKSRFWELTEERLNLDSARKDSGYWRLTEKGRSFVAGLTTIPERVLLYNNTCEGFEGSEIDIQEALGKAFNYAELMSA